jgi:hypothetical protein
MTWISSVFRRRDERFPVKRVGSAVGNDNEYHPNKLDHFGKYSKNKLSAGALSSYIRSYYTREVFGGP